MYNIVQLVLPCTKRVQSASKWQFVQVQALTSDLEKATEQSDFRDGISYPGDGIMASAKRGEEDSG